jgi:cyanophycin synthetase
MAAGSPVLFLYEKLAMAHDALAALGASPWPAEAAARPSPPAPPAASRLS